MREYSILVAMTTKCCEAVHRSIALLGGVAPAAEQLGVTRQVVTNWKKRGVSATYVLTLGGLVDHQVSAKELRPDIFGRK